MIKLIFTFVAAFALQPLFMILCSIIFMNYPSDCSKAYADLASWLFCFYLSEFVPIFTWKRLPFVFIGFFTLKFMELKFKWPYSFVSEEFVYTNKELWNYSFKSSILFSFPTVFTLLARKIKNLIVLKSRLQSEKKAQAR